MDEQITIEAMQLIIGRLTINYELQISRLTVELQRVSQSLAENAPDTKQTKGSKD